jgi:hypothetical protein
MPRPMADLRTVTPLLKRGALLAAANWEVIVLQFLAESAFKLLLIVPVLGAAFLLALLAGESAVDVAARDARQVVSLLMAGLLARPGALAAYLAGMMILVVGGATITFLAKGGAVAVLVRAERHAPPVERPPLRLAVFRRAGAFRVERYGNGAQRLFSRYLTLGIILMVVYALVGAAYLAAVYGAYRVVASTGLGVAWTLVATAISGVLVAVITVVNLLYLLTQLVIAADDCGVAAAFFRVGEFLRREAKPIGILFGALLVIVGLATIASLLAMASLGVIGFVPIVGLAVVPIQLLAWLVRALVFQYLGLTALCAYVRLYRGDAVAATAGVPGAALSAEWSS